MESRVKFLGHAVHPMLVMFPLGALGFSVASDALHSCLGQRRHADAAALALDFGIVSAVLAAPVGALDWRAIAPASRAKRVGLWHALGNAAVLGLFASSRWLRSRRGEPPATAKWLSAAGFVLTGVTAWLGAELVEHHGIGIPGKDAEHAPSSLSASDQPMLPGIAPASRHSAAHDRTMDLAAARTSGDQPHGAPFRR